MRGKIVGVGPAVDDRRIGQRVTGLLWNGLAEFGQLLKVERMGIAHELAGAGVARPPELECPGPDPIQRMLLESAEG